MDKLPCDLSCPKCGAKDFYAKLWAKNEVLPQFDNRSRERIQKIMWRESTVDEHIHMHCRFCHYQFVVDPADVANKKSDDALLAQMAAVVKMVATIPEKGGVEAICVAALISKDKAQQALAAYEARKGLA